MSQITRFTGRWGFLSNFSASPLLLGGMEYPTGEHAYNAGKTFDWRMRYRIAHAPTAKHAKRIGRRMPLRPDWDNIRYQVMEQVLWAKFTCHPGRIEALLSTEDALLVEGNHWHDQHWGCCMCGREKCAEPGQNHLGRLLMELRDELRLL